jgi:extradiol dioxygenase family protein
MPVALNHTIVRAYDKTATARHYTTILGLPDRTTFGPFAVVMLGNDVSSDVADDHGTPTPQHYAFLVGEAEFDAILGRLVERGITYYADPFRRRPGEVNGNDGGRGLYWVDPNGHSLEIITVPYGGWTG